MDLLLYTYSILKNSAEVQLYIDKGEAAVNKKIFDHLYSHKQKIESEFGESLVWERLDDKKACNITFQVDEKGLRDKENWPEIIEKMVKAMVNFEKALREEIR
ncbi:MAG: DUF4268 domain-containing protein [Candidatus Bathyarchaeota archaeon]|nr:DUF4268 domain-containing protein [Candidatus Bathyarchaeota archaeon]